LQNAPKVRGESIPRADERALFESALLRSLSPVAGFEYRAARATKAGACRAGATVGSPRSCFAASSSPVEISREARISRRYAPSSPSGAALAMPRRKSEIAPWVSEPNVLANERSAISGEGRSLRLAACQRSSERRRGSRRARNHTHPTRGSDRRLLDLGSKLASNSRG